MKYFSANLFSSLPAFHRADGEAESSRTGDVWNVHVVVQPLIPPGIQKVIVVKLREIPAQQHGM